MELFAVCRKNVDLNDNSIFYSVYVPGIECAIGTGETKEEAIDEVEGKLPELLDHIVQWEKDLVVCSYEDAEHIGRSQKDDPDLIHMLNKESTFETVVCVKVKHDAFDSYKNIKPFCL